MFIRIKGLKFARSFGGKGKVCIFALRNTDPYIIFFGRGVAKGPCLARKEGGDGLVRMDSVQERDWSCEDHGLMAEWLGKGLQNLVQRFESASDLTETALQMSATRFSFEFVRHLYGKRVS